MFIQNNDQKRRHFQKPEDHPNFRKNALGEKRPFSELSESSGVFSEQLSELEIPFSEYEIPFSEWPLTTWSIWNPQFSEQLSERFPELPRTHPKNFHLPLHSRSVFSRIGVVPAHQTFWSWCVSFLITGRVPILSKQPEFWGFRLFFWLCWGGRLGIGPKWAKRVQNTTKVGILHCLRSEITLELLFRVVGCLFYRNTLYMLDSRWRAHLTPCQKASSRPTKYQKRLLSAEWSPCEQRFGVHLKAG